MRICLLATVLLGLLGGCAAVQRPLTTTPDLRPISIGASADYPAHVVAEGLSNPCHVSFRPNGGVLTVCDSAAGRILLVGGQVSVLRQGFETEYWKRISRTENYYKIGPLFALWLDQDNLAVGNGGAPDGKEGILFLRDGEIVDGTNSIGPTSQPPVDIDLGEGNFVGPVLAPDGNIIYACAHGNDAKTWIVRIDVRERRLETLFSADDAGVSTNSPMQCLLVRGNLLVLYSGAVGVDDGLAVEYDLTTFKPVDQWLLPGLVDPMGIAPVPGTVDEYIVTDNNWDLTSVKDGKLARVKLEPRKPAQITVIADKIKGPVHCAFGPDRRLYVACLGEMFDARNGMVIAVGGIK